MLKDRKTGSSRPTQWFPPSDGLAALARDGHVQAVREQVQGRVHQRDRDVDRGKESESIVVEPCGEQDEAVLEPRRLDRPCQIHIGLLRPGILDEFEGPHRPDPPGLSDPLVALGHLVEALADPGLQALRPGEGLLDFVHGPEGRGAHDRVAAECPPQAPRAGRIHHRRLPRHAAEGQTPADRLAAHEDVGNRAPVLNRPHFPGAPGARLDLVIDQDDAVLIAQASEEREEFLWRDDHAPSPWTGSARIAATRPATSGWLISRSNSSTRAFATSAGARPCGSRYGSA